MIRLPGGARVTGRLPALLLLAAAVGLFLATVPLHRNWFDLRVYHEAVHHWVHDGGPLYGYRVPGQDYGFTYPPFAALCMLPLALLDWPAALTAGLLVNAAATAAVVVLLAGPVLRGRVHGRRYALAVTGCLVLLLEPVRDTLSFGQVNLVLLALVLADTRLAAHGGRAARFAGLGTGLAAAVKLTPALFIGYLLLAGRRRAAAVAAATAVAATLLAAWAAPGTSHDYWTEALRDTDRIGDLAYISNQSLQGLLARLAGSAGDAGRAVWAVGVVLVLAVWARRVRRARAAGDTAAGPALTGAAACLISPVTWVHHLVWLLPALAVLAAAALSRPPGRRAAPFAVAVGAYVLLCSSVVWLWRSGAPGVGGFLGGNAYVWLALAMLLALPVGAGSQHLPADQRVQRQDAGQQR
ncbi:glycosyltransferase 87 family protein [Streptomyces aidingensis]|uniref:Alpha-1,2-mannosyltransferase n=1 Tax=Streptomyces aidingensis TaxID=910347 RepID=A0A1I1U9G5_9ACTN|nr:glycosyltransferase 87 family protein [Streptomyces aidingensis]SFD67511.1 alpha-1,2-mannosyltransferase [Streptomyces aidingensis]